MDISSFRLPPPPSPVYPSPYATEPTPIVHPLDVSANTYELPPPPTLASTLSGIFTGQNSVPVSALATNGKAEIAGVPGIKKGSHLIPVKGFVNDGATYGILGVFKLVRVMVLWIALFFVDRAYQSTFLRRVMVEDASPPSLMTVAVAALAIEAFFSLVFIGVMTLLSGRFKRPNNTFVIDGPTLGLLWSHYLRSTIVILALGTALGAIAQNDSNTRYREDGMRGIRALCSAILLVSVVVILFV